MNLEYVPLLQVQRNLYNLPRGFERFREYLRTMIDPDSGDLKLPLVAMNPMGKDHLPLFLDKLIELNADGEAARATTEVQSVLKVEPGEYKVCLVVSDDLRGGWTNRYTTEFDHRFRQKAYYKRGWIAGILWTSETYIPAQVREEVRLCLFRAAYIQRHGYARTLGEMLAQESYAMSQPALPGPLGRPETARQALRMADSTTPTLDPDDLAYTREVLASYLDKIDQPTLIAALYGDAAAHQLGYPPLGLSPRAGLALALDNAKKMC
ncbi:MAG: hypothetical protein ACREOI_23330 [bacterium]